MNTVATLIFLLIVISTFGQQNLAPNPSFENMITCPQGNNEYPLSCESWNMISQSGSNGATSDYYNACGGIGFNSWGCDVETTSATPQNCSGYQFPRTGDAYCGFLAYVESLETINYKEYIGAKLLVPLEEKATYCVEFYVSLADSCYFAVDEIAAFFGPDSLPQVWAEPINLVPQVVNTNGVIEDKENWIKITGYHTAVGDEKFMFIGSYNDYSNTTIINLTNPPLGDTNNSNYRSAYYYVDDISVCLQENGACECKEYITNGSDNSDLDYKLPNVFTPNGDLVNDIWTTNFLYEDEYVIILNRWGNEMIKLDIANPNWNGIVEGKAVSEGTYYYLAWIRGEQKHGFIHLVR